MAQPVAQRTMRQGQAGKIDDPPPWSADSKRSDTHAGGASLRAVYTMRVQKFMLKFKGVKFAPQRPSKQHRAQRT